MTKEVTKIVVADEHFLYLPLYYASHSNYFGKLPKNCEIQIRRSAMRTDVSAFTELLDDQTPRNHGVDIAVCDPACVLENTDPGSSPVVLAGLITNSAFWAVNHKSGRVQHLKHLRSFENIISFKKGTTSFGIATQIFKGPAKASGIITVNPSAELTHLVEKGPGTVALSPDILGIQTLIESHNDTFGIELALGETQEYHDMLVTALLTRADVLTSKPELIKGFLEAMQIALFNVRIMNDEVVAYATRRFHAEESTIRNALAKAAKVDVYPPNITVSKPTWMKLSDIAAHSWGRGVDERSRVRALDVYRKSVEPYSYLASNAVKTVEAELAKRNVPFWEMAGPWVAGILPLLMFLTLFLAHALTAPALLPWYSYLVLISVVAGAVATAQLVGFRPWRLDGLVYWGMLVGVLLAMMALFDLPSTQMLANKLLGANVGDPAKWLVGIIVGGIMGLLKWIHMALRDRRQSR